MQKGRGVFLPQIWIDFGQVLGVGLEGMGQSTAGTKTEQWGEENDGWAREAACKWGEGPPHLCLSLTIYYLLRASQGITSLRLHSNPLRYELSLAPVDPVRPHDLSEVPLFLSSRIGTRIQGCWDGVSTCSLQSLACRRVWLKKTGAPEQVFGQALA